MLLAAILAAFALPATAGATTASVADFQLVIQSDTAGVDNNMSVLHRTDGRIEIVDSGQAIQTGAGCTPGAGKVICSGANRIFVGLAGGNDTLTAIASLGIRYRGGDGNDVLLTGTGVGPSKVEFDGGSGRDTVSYAAATRPVVVTQDSGSNDGRTGIGGDGDNIGDDVEVLQGSRFADSLSGSVFNQSPVTVDGLGGDDALTGGGGNDVFRTALGDGADRIDGSVGFDTVDYRTRTRSVAVRVDAGGADDGEAGERDEVLDMEQVVTGSGDDTITGSPFATRDSSFVSGAGVDRITGTDLRDGITPGPGRDTVDARGGSDIVRARDGEADTIACGGGTGIDTLQADLDLELASGCEAVEPVGELRLDPRAVAVGSDRAARLGISWRHPRAWRQVGRISVLVRDGERRVGEIAISPRAGRMSATGAVELVRRASRVRRSGRSIGAQLALRLDPSLAGRRLAIDVEAADVAGRRQLERNAGAIRVAA